MGLSDIVTKTGKSGEGEKKLRIKNWLKKKKKKKKND